MRSLRIEFLSDIPSGPRRVRDDNWSGQTLLCSRPHIDSALQGDVLDVSGVYILVGPSELKNEGQTLRFQSSIYIGQGDSVRDRIQSHLKNKEFWREAVVFYRQPDELHAGNIKYLESRLIQLATAAGNCVLENAVSPQTPALAVAEKESTEDFLKHAIFCLGAIGYDFFTAQAVVPPFNGGPGPSPTEAYIPQNLQGLIDQLREIIEPLPDAEMYTTKSPDWRAKVTVGSTFRVFIRVMFRRDRIRIRIADGAQRDIHVGQKISDEIANEIRQGRAKAVEYLSAKTKGA
jgi:hypothetical protein